MTIKIKVTTAGRAALVNAQNTGTNEVLVSAIGITDQAFEADETTAALPGQLKQLVTFSGAAVAADTIHITIRDFSADTYSLRGFALFLADGTLFASYGQADPILEKSAQAAALLAADVIFADIDAAMITFGDTNFLNPPATTEVQGVVELATDAETTTGTDAVRAVTPKGLLAALNARFGAGAPSAFIKTLLTAASAAALRVLIEIKGASLFDAGAGNGLDADLLDGQHGTYYRQWANLQNVPASFPPSAHQHSAADITSGVLPVARGGTGVGAVTAGNYLVGAGTDPLIGKTPAQVLNDIAAAPKIHSHDWAELRDPPATATRWPSYAEVTGKPSTYPPSTHEHDITDVSHMNGGAGWARMSGDPDNDDVGGSWRILTGGVRGAYYYNGSEVFGVDSSGNTDINGMLTQGAIKNESNINAINGTRHFSFTQASVGAWSDSGTYDGGGLQISTPGQKLQIAGSTRSILRYRMDDTGDGSAWSDWYSVVLESPSGNASIAGEFTAASGNFTGSDERLKLDIVPISPRPLHRDVPLCSYVLRDNGKPSKGPIAQHVQRAAGGDYVNTFPHRDGPRLGVDKESLALEIALWAAHQVDALSAEVAELRAQLAQRGG